MWDKSLTFLTLNSTARNAKAVYAADGSVILEAFENSWPRILALGELDFVLGLRSSFVLQINMMNDEMGELVFCSTRSHEWEE